MSLRIRSASAFVRLTELWRWTVTLTVLTAAAAPWGSFAEPAIATKPPAITAVAINLSLFGFIGLLRR